MSSPPRVERTGLTAVVPGSCPEDEDDRVRGWKSGNHRTRTEGMVRVGSEGQEQALQENRAPTAGRICLVSRPVRDRIWSGRPLPFHLGPQAHSTAGPLEVPHLSQWNGAGEMQPV